MCIRGPSLSAPLLQAIHAVRPESFPKCRRDNLSKTLLLVCTPLTLPLLPGSTAPSLTLDCLCPTLELWWASSDSLVLSRPSLCPHAVAPSGRTSVHHSCLRFTGISKPGSGCTASWRRLSLKALAVTGKPLFSFPCLCGVTDHTEGNWPCACLFLQLRMSFMRMETMSYISVLF